MSEPDDLRYRFGNKAFYQDDFLGVDRSNIRAVFESLDAHKGKSSTTDNYEVSRQYFLKLLGQHKMLWRPTNEEFDMYVDVSRIYRQDRSDYIAFMRIQPKGFRAERRVPAGLEIKFHVLIGRITFAYRKKTKVMSRGQHITVRQKTVYSIRCCISDEPAYLIFQIVEKKSEINVL